MLIQYLLAFLVDSILAKDEVSKKEDSKGFMKWKRVNPMLTKVVTPYGVQDVCGVHRSEPRELILRLPDRKSENDEIKRINILYQKKYTQAVGIGNFK